jgi:protein-ribulosamine 3-kinase
MLPQKLYEHLKKLLAQQFNTSVAHLQVQSVGGGSINETYKLTFSNTHTLFCKVNDAARFPQMFVKEAQGLVALCKTNTIETPQVILHGHFDPYQFLVLEWIESGAKTITFFKTFGERLAALHQNTNESFGWETDNYMGSVRQQNNFQNDWNNFFIKQRLEPLVQQCLSKKRLTQNEHEDFKKLYQKLPQFFDMNEKPALLHGDLWSGNYLCNRNDKPVLIDPAVYYGHRCMDIAMTTLFGGFDKNFYESYHYHFPLPKDCDVQLKICNLYPLLIHLLLFGQSYLTSIQQTLRFLL